MLKTRRKHSQSLAISSFFFICIAVLYSVLSFHGKIFINLLNECFTKKVIFTNLMNFELFTYLTQVIAYSCLTELFSSPVGLTSQAIFHIETIINLCRKLCSTVQKLLVKLKRVKLKIDNVFQSL